MIETPLWILIVGSGLAFAGYIAIGALLMLHATTIRDRRDLCTSGSLAGDIVLLWPIIFPVVIVATFWTIRKKSKR